MLNARIKGLTIFSMLLGLFLLNTQYTDADIFAERNIRGNAFRATTINFSAKSNVSNTAVNFLFRTLGLVSEGYDFGAVKIKKETTQPIKYRLKAVKTNGDDNLCNSINIQVLQRNWSSRYNGKLMNLVVDSVLNNDTPEDWIFFLSLDQAGDNLQNKICEFNLEFKSYRDSPDETGGVYAKRVLNNSVSTGNW